MSADVVQVLEDAARGNGMAYDKWPDVLQIALQRIDHAVYNEFPPVKVPVLGQALPSSSFSANGADPGHATPPPPSPGRIAIPVTPQPPAGSAAGANNDNGNDESAPTETPGASSPSVVPNSQPPLPDEETPLRSAAAASSLARTGAQTVNMVEPPAGTLPPALSALYEQIQGALHGPFGTMPPYTFQRLAELVLEPTKHYRTLPAYLRALDKVLSVSSTADVYPLKVDSASGNSAGGSGSALDSFMAQSNGAYGMHEGFNGAELTRIPWVRGVGHGDHDVDSDDGEADAPGEMIDGSGHTQQGGEQRVHGGPVEGHMTTLVNGMGRTGAGAGPGAGGVPADSAAMLVGDGRAGPHADGVDESNIPHARGPQEIGNEDIGPQRADGGGMPGIVDLEAAVGRPGEGEVVPGSSVQIPEDRARSISADSGKDEKPDEAIAEDSSMAVDQTESQADVGASAEEGTAEGEGK